MKRNYRKRRHNSSSEEEEKDEDVRQTLEEAKEVQKYRQRPKGVSAVGLALGKKYSREDDEESDPFKLKTGGLVKLNKTRDNAANDDDDEIGVSLKETFATETRHREEDKRMMQYIDDQMSKKKGDKIALEKELNSFEAKKAALYALPESLRAESSQRSEGMLSNQMLSGIPEVDLGIEEKFRNIAETERAKRKATEEKLRKKGEGETLVPTNMAADFVHHNRFMKEDAVHKKGGKKEESEAAKPKLTVGCLDEQNPLDPVVKETALTNERGRSKKISKEKATDNYHFEKFRKKSTKRF